MTTATPTSTETRALALLGQGIEPGIVANAVGVDASRISQLLSDENFAAQVAELRYENLAKHNIRDNKYDNVEDKLLDMLEDCIPLMHRPMEILKAISVINAAKRRGSSTPEATINKQQVISLVVPVQIINKFQANLQGQVIKAGDQELVTIQSGSLDSLLQEKRNGRAALINGNQESERSATAG